MVYLQVYVLAAQQQKCIWGSDKAISADHGIESVKVSCDVKTVEC